MGEKKQFLRMLHNGGKCVHSLYAALLIGLLAAGGICICVLPQQTYAEEENRYLTTLPQIQLDGIFSGEVQRDLTEAANDQFPGRARWMQAATAVQYALYHRELNGVYIGADGHLFEKVLASDLSEKNYAANISYVTALADTVDADVSLMLVPTAGTVLSDKLPHNAPLYDAAPYEALGMELCEADSVRWIDVREELARAAHKQRTRELYFCTDHHWTAYGAYIGAETYLETQHMTLAPQEQFDLQTKSSAFYGTLAAKAAGLPGMQADTLTLPVALPKNLTIETNGAPADAVAADGTHVMPALEGIYDLSKLEQKDKYAVYFGGNYGRLTIKNPDAATDKRLLLIKDSYANSMVAYLLDTYAQITLIDLRYLNDSISALAKQGWDEVLVCYEMSNFIKDKNLLKLLR